MRRNSKFSSLPSKNYEMARVMVSQWNDDRLKTALGKDLVRAYAVSITEAEEIIKKELRRRNWA
jgi:hypothetical protein